MRPIDADELSDRILYLLQSGVPSQDIRRGIKKVYTMLCDTPTIEAEPVNHSKWIPIDHTNDAYCESCGCERGSKAWNKDDFNFCQNCGARMDGD